MTPEAINPTPRRKDTPLHTSGREVVGQVLNHPTARGERIVVCSQSLEGNHPSWADTLFSTDLFTFGFITPDNRLFWYSGDYMRHEKLYGAVFPDAPPKQDYVTFSILPAILEPPEIILVSYNEASRPSINACLDYFRRSVAHEGLGDRTIARVEYTKDDGDLVSLKKPLSLMQV